MALISGGPLAPCEWRSMNARQRAAATGLVLGLHLAVIAGFIVAGLRSPPVPPEPILQVSLISDAVTAAAQPSAVQSAEPTPAPPSPTPPQPTVLSTRAQTPSPMSAPPVEQRVADLAPAAPAPTPSPAPAAAASSGAPASAPGAMTPPNFRAAYLNNPGPAYPAASRRKREEGVVRLRVQVSAEGAPSQVLLDRSSGFPELDGAALDIVKKRWRFVPAQQGGQPVSAWVLVPLEFSIKR